MENNRLSTTTNNNRKIQKLLVIICHQGLAAELEDERQELRSEVRRAKRGADTVTPEMQADIECLLEAFGIPFVHAPAEAEAQCAFLVEARLVDAVASDACQCFAILFACFRWLLLFLNSNQKLTLFLLLATLVRMTRIRLFLELERSIEGCFPRNIW